MENGATGKAQVQVVLTWEEREREEGVEGVYMEWQCPPKGSFRKILTRGTVAGGT